MRRPLTLPHRQRGIALLITLIIIVLGASYLLVDKLTRAQKQLEMENDKQTAMALARAKEALIGWSLSYNEGGIQHYGLFPFPDRNGDVGGYDGGSDCVNDPAFNVQFLRGRLPWFDLNGGCQNATAIGVGLDPEDGFGEKLWYIVSGNVIDHGAGVPDTSPAALSNPALVWLRVVDNNGVQLSNRVVAILISPGAALPGQTRAGAAPAISAYLDQILIGGVPFNHADLTATSFVKRTPITSCTGATDCFNDLLVYITVEELLPLLCTATATAPGTPGC